MLTVPGGRKYLAESVSTFFASGGRDLWIKAFPQEEGLPPAPHGTLGHMRLLSMFPDDDKIIFEDDLQFAGNFWQKAMAAIEAALSIRTRTGPVSLSVVSFYVPGGRRHRCKPSGLPGLLTYPAMAYYGTQAIWYSALAAIAFGQWLFKRKNRIGEQDFPFDSDGELRRWLLATPEAVLYATERDLVQHVGKDSLIGPASRPHRAGAFTP